MTGERSAISDGAMVAVVGVALALAGAVWLWGGIAGALFGAGWPHISLPQLLEVIVRLPGRITQPATAWPPGARRLLPSPAGLYAALGMVAALAGAAVAVASRSGLAAAAFP